MRRRWIMVLAFLGAACTAGMPEIPAPPGGSGRVAVFDIDGTLTPDVWAINVARPDAARTVAAYAAAGVSVIYLSARHPLLQAGVRDWLARNGFPSGQLYMPRTVAENAQPAAFKIRILSALAAPDWTIVAAYGDSTSDFEAYAAVGIPGNRVFGLNRKGRSGCEPGIEASRCFESWAALLPLARLED
jgi:phosphoserine phosphatase